MQQLQVVDDDQIEAVLRLQAAAFGADLRDSQDGRVVDEQVRFGKRADSVHDARLLRLGMHAQTEAGRVDVGLSGEQAHGKLFAGHL